MTYQFCASKVIFQFDGSSVQLVLLRQHMLENIVWDVDTRMEKYRVEGRSLPTWTKTYIMELLAIWDFSLKLYTYKSAKFYLRKQKARFYWVWNDVEVVVLLHEFQFIGRHGAFARQMIAWLMTGEKATTTAAINWIY